MRVFPCLLSPTSYLNLLFCIEGDRERRERGKSKREREGDKERGRKKRPGAKYS